MVLVPRDGFQKAMAMTKVDHLLAGGVAGPGKTWGLGYDALFDYNFKGDKKPDWAIGDSYPAYCLPLFRCKKYRAVIFRRSYSDASDLIDQLVELYEPLGAKFYGAPRYMFEFPSGARIQIGHMNNIEDWRNYRGKETHFFGFDEMAEFYREQVFGVLPWLRSTVEGVRPRLQGTCNWEGPGVDWIKDYWQVKCPCPKHKGENGVITRQIVIDGFTTNVTTEFIPGDRKGSVIEEKDPAYLGRLAIQCGGEGTARFQALGLGCCEVLKARFWQTFGDKHVIPDDWDVPGDDWTWIGGHDFASSIHGDASAFVLMRVNSRRDVVVEREWYGWGYDVLAQAEAWWTMYKMCSQVYSGEDVFSMNQGGEIHSIADQFRLVRTKVVTEPIVLLKAGGNIRNSVSYIQSAIDAVRFGMPGGLYIRQRCQRLIGDFGAMLNDRLELDVYDSKQRITVKYKGVDKQYHFDIFNAMRVGFIGMYSNPVRHTEQRHLSKRDRALERLHEREPETANCSFTVL